MNFTMISGNVTKKGSELRSTQGGDKILSFSLGVSNGKDKQGNWRDKTFFDCSLWGKRGEALEQYITGGTALELTGRVSAREHQGKAYLQLSVDRVEFSPKSFESDNSQGDYSHSQDQGGAPAGGGNFDDEIPFICEWR